MNNQGTCANYCQTTDRCLIDDINIGRFDSKPDRLSTYIKGPGTKSADFYDFVKNTQEEFSINEELYEPFDLDSEEDDFEESLQASLSPNEEGYDNTFMYINGSYDDYELTRQFVWRKQLQCGRLAGRYCISTAVTINNSLVPKTKTTAKLV